MVIFTAQLIGAAIAVLVAMTLFPVAQAPAAGEDWQRAKIWRRAKSWPLGNRRAVGFEIALVASHRVAVWGALKAR